MINNYGKQNSALYLSKSLWKEKLKNTICLVKDVDDIIARFSETQRQ